MCLESDKLGIFKEVLGNKLGVEQDQLRVKVHFADFNVFRKLRLRQGKLLENLDDDLLFL